MHNHLEKLLKSPEMMANQLAREPLAYASQAPASFTLASVLMLMQPDTQNGTQVWFIRRSARLRRHAGQIAFPGGKQEAGDAGPWETALRESQEEIGLEPQGVVQLGRLPEILTPTGFRIIPFVGWNEAQPPKPQANDEVDLAFSLSLSQLFAEGTESHSFVTPHGTIWGATARILQNCLKILRTQEA